MQEWLVATRSEHKLREIREILGERSPLRLVAITDLGLEPSVEEDVIEAFPSFRENAIAKARYFSDLTGMPTLADDSGISVDALGGAPGVRSKRFSPDYASGGDVANNRHLLHVLSDVPLADRRAQYVCVAVGMRPDSEPVVAEGQCAGMILDTARGGGGFGYDPLFLVDGLDATFGELPASVKNQVSHRARAFLLLAKRLGVG
jgi:XTP/dITP diphosphohydrolase